MKAFIRAGSSREEIFIPLKEERLSDFITDLSNYMHGFAEENGTEDNNVMIEFC